jgi:toxin CptA
MAATGDGFKYSGGAPANDPAWRVVIVLGPSSRTLAWVVAVAAAALAATLAADLPAPAKAAIACALGIATVRAARRARQAGQGAVRRFTVDLSGRVEVERADGRHVAGRLTDDAFVAPWLTVLRWVPEGARYSRSIVVAPDAAQAEAFRRLRILLRWR